MSREKAYKPKKTINISLQSKKYYEPINEVLAEWEKNGLQASTEVCESILWSKKLNSSMTLISVLNAYSTAEKMLSLYSMGAEYDDLESKLEAVISSAITVDVNKLIEAVKVQCDPSNMVKKVSPLVKEENKVIEEVTTTPSSTIETENNIIQNQNISTNSIVTKDEIRKGEEAVERYEVVEDESNDEEDDKYAISSDFLFNS